MSKTSLSQIQEKLSLKNMAVELLAGSGQLPFPHLKLDLGPDSKQRPLFALMWLFSPSQKGVEDQLLQIFIPLPFLYEEGALFSMARYLLMLNKVTPFPGWGLSEPDRGLYYKYTLTFSQGQVKAELIENFLGAVQLMLDTHTPQIEAAASGQATFEQLTSY